jgi:hypothetical protein
MAALVTYSICLKTPSGAYVTLTVQATSDTEAIRAVRDLAGGGQVAWVRRLG